MLAVVNGTDITKFINKKSYKVNAEKNFETWKDGNYLEHRIYTRPKVKGSFEVVLYGQDQTFTEDFLSLWNGAVDNDVVTISVFVQNHNKMEAIEAYFDITGTSHKDMINGNYCDKLTINIKEK